ncbi:AAA family ATPase [Pseudoponticoccus marisrubri]|uniref:Aminoglycoside phosphotransferase domain-containing protein n=1 Tax=Pseudoponticoccus marisrubri TaxID=1685382 RepID=A0A0W7WMK9_9RHOB|nr:bifunctional aminoglycoside phosphotransferase/ATP-binding protein [Pseudoponticoccus marisrubri]KUF11826.1 hypothetical protein AVJ23_04390 [Pseudoponticoccus marisrubri]
MTDQSEILRFLKDPGTHPGAPEVTEIQTHGAHVFLAGEMALKIKRAVRYDYLDYSTLAAREAALRRELELNAPAAPTLYRDVIPVTREADGRLALDGDGRPVEWVLRMVRFPDDDQLDRVAARGALDRALAEALGARIADYHAAAPLRRGPDGAGPLRDILAELGREFAGMGDALPEKTVRDLLDRAAVELENRAALLDARASAGHVRRCHGDLHLSNIVLLDGVPHPFDALEFSEALGTCDVLYDLAFLLMDLLHRGLGMAANAVLNSYVSRAGRPAHLDGLAALPLFLSVRAAISAMVAVQTARARGGDEDLPEQARRYLQESGTALHPVPPRLVAIGGLSGTGKTTLARALAPALGRAPGAVHLRSDVIRKALHGVDPLTRLPEDAYTPGMTAQVYAAMEDGARAALAAGQSVIVDAVFLKPTERASLATVADETGATFAGLWLEAPEPVLLQRVTGRRGDASDADARIVRMQTGLPRGALDWRSIDASGGAEATRTAACEALALSPDADGTP